MRPIFVVPILMFGVLTIPSDNRIAQAFEISPVTTDKSVRSSVARESGEKLALAQGEANASYASNGNSMAIPTPRNAQKLQLKPRVISSDGLVSGMIRQVPFYSQFTDISSKKWQPNGCGIASLAMIIEYYSPGAVSVDLLLKQALAQESYLPDAGWKHSGLIAASKKYGLTGTSQDYSKSSKATALLRITEALEQGPVMASVHYTFDPKNPIPHLVVITAIDGDVTYYNDPAEKKGNQKIATSVFQRAWKQRFIVLRPVLNGNLALSNI